MASSLSPGDVGARVVVRRPLPGGRVGDVLGDLLAWSDGRLTIRTRSGVVTVAEADVLAGKRVPPAVPRHRDVLALEAAAADGWPGLEQHRIGRWLLRAGGGFTGRANAMLPLGDPGLPVAPALDAVEAWYAARGLPARVQVPLPTCAPLDRVLAERGYAVREGAAVLTADLGSLTADPARGEVTLRPECDDDWLGRYHYRGGELPHVARQVLSQVTAGELAFASVRRDGEVLAIGRAAATSGWLGVTALEVAPAHRRRGLGRLVLQALARWGAEHGARSCYMQVAPSNEGALGFYERLGLSAHHRYHYRVREAGEPDRSLG